MSSSQSMICVQMRTHQVFRRTHRVCPKTQGGSVSSLLRNSTLETVFRPFPIYLLHDRQPAHGRRHSLPGLRCRLQRIGIGKISGLQKGPAERGHVKKRQESSKSVKKFFDTFRHFSHRAKNVKNRQKVSKIFKSYFRHFSTGTSFPAPLLS